MTDVFEGVPEDTKAQLLRAKDQTRRTGILIEAQVLQLRLWPQVVLKDVLDVTIDPLDIENKTIHYLLRVKTPPRGQDLEKRAGVLEEWVHTLLGDDWVFNIKVRQKKGGPGKLVWRGKRLQPLDAVTAHPKADLKAYEFTDALTTFKRYRMRDVAAAFEAAAVPPTPIPPKKV